MHLNCFAGKRVLSCRNLELLLPCGMLGYCGFLSSSLRVLYMEFVNRESSVFIEN